VQRQQIPHQIYKDANGTEHCRVSAPAAFWHERLCCLLSSTSEAAPHSSSTTSTPALDVYAHVQLVISNNAFRTTCWLEGACLQQVAVQHDA
jgi:hypothetical protein